MLGSLFPARILLVNGERNVSVCGFIGGGRTVWSVILSSEESIARIDVQNVDVRRTGKSALPPHLGVARESNGRVTAGSRQ